MKIQKTICPLAITLVFGATHQSMACTGITLTAKDASTVVARTIDWSGSEMNNIYVVVPRGQKQQSLLPNGTYGGKKFTAKYGFVGLGVQQPEFVVDGTNEMGLSAGLFYFPKYGKYRPYSESLKEKSLADFQVVSWILSQFATINELKAAIDGVQIINIDPTASTTHWRITEPNGHQVVMEIIDGVATFHENPLGVLANAPDFTWQTTNLNSYVNLYPGTAKPQKFGPITLQSFSGNTGMLGLPGDFSSPSRFVRAAFLKTTAIQQPNGYKTAMQSFHLLNNLDEPFGFDWAQGTATFDMPSATQWTIASDITNRKIYYHTMYDRTIREIDMNKIDFTTVPFQYHPLDKNKQETVIPTKIDM